MSAKNIPSSDLVSSFAENPLSELNQSDLQMENQPFVRGRFSHIYKGTYKGKKVVVKRLNGNMERLKDQFLTEVLLLG